MTAWLLTLGLLVLAALLATEALAIVLPWSSFRERFYLVALLVAAYQTVEFAYLVGAR